MLKPILLKMTHVIPDKLYLKIRYRARFHKRLNLKSPVTFSEKIQWLKLYDRRPEYAMMVDKYEVKKYVADTIGEEYIIPTLGVWNSFDEIDFDALPNSFVLKCTHDSGGLVICKDKSEFDKSAAKKRIEAAMKAKYYYHGREWAYKMVKPRIIAEQYMEDATTKDLRDYKFFAFDGQTEMLFIATERQEKDSETKFDFFDMDFNHLDFRNGHPNADKAPQKPQNFQLMHALSDKLSKGIPHVRVDFYEVDGRVYFGELTFCHWSGLMPFEPHEWDEKLGSFIKLPQKTR